MTGRKRVALASIAVALLYPLTSAARPVERFGFLWGAALTNRSFQTGSARELATDSVWGWALGGYVEWNLPWNRWSLATEFTWVEKGYSREALVYRGGLVVESVERRDQYVSVPVLLTRELSGSRFRPYVFAGPSLEILVRDLSDWHRLPRSNAAVHLGAGVRWTKGLDVRVRYVHDISDATGTSPAGIGRMRSSGVMLAVGVGAVMAPSEVK